MDLKYINMRFETQQILLEQYNKLNSPKPTTAIKYYFQYEKVNVNVYFDAYDKSNLSMCLILNYEKEYYYTSLNVNNTKIKTEYLEKIPINILSKILDENKQLNNFYHSIESHIENAKFKIINYKDDILFKNTLSFSSHRKDLPFIRGIRKAQMTDKTFKNLNETMGIDINILKQIKGCNMTLVRADDPKLRKNITLILKDLDARIWKICWFRKLRFWIKPKKPNKTYIAQITDSTMRLYNIKVLSNLDKFYYIQTQNGKKF